MKLNFKKTKERILGSMQNNPPASLCVNGNVIDTVKCFKLLGINISDDLCKSGIQIILLKNPKAFWAPTTRLAVLVEICHTLNR